MAPGPWCPGCHSCLHTHCPVDVSTTQRALCRGQLLARRCKGSWYGLDGPAQEGASGDAEEPMMSARLCVASSAVCDLAPSPKPDPPGLSWPVQHCELMDIRSDVGQAVIPRGAGREPLARALCHVGRWLCSRHEPRGRPGIGPGLGGCLTAFLRRRHCFWSRERADPPQHSWAPGKLRVVCTWAPQGIGGRGVKGAAPL